jgi:hypothetical protein
VPCSRRDDPSEELSPEHPAPVRGPAFLATRSRTAPLVHRTNLWNRIRIVAAPVDKPDNTSERTAHFVFCPPAELKLKT